MNADLVFLKLTTTNDCMSIKVFCPTLSNIRLFFPISIFPIKMFLKWMQSALIYKYLLDVMDERLISDEGVQYNR